MTIRNVSIGDKFIKGKVHICEVVDFYEVKSLVTGKVVEHLCIARGINTLATNTFETPFSSVIRNKIS